MKYHVRLSLVILAAIGLGCSKGAETSSSSTITMSGKIASTSGSSFEQISTQALSDYKIYCLTFAATPTAASSVLASDGAFSLSLPANTPFGCFINLVSNNSTIATLVIDGAGSGFGNQDSSNFSLAGSADLGSLDLDLTNNKVVVPAAKVAGSASTANGFEITELDGKSAIISCVTTGIAELDAACSASVGGPVYFNVLKATKSSEVVYGLGVWESSSAYAACGSSDLNAATKTAIETDGYIFDTTGAYAPSVGEFTWDATNCPNRDSSVVSLPTTAQSHEAVKKYFCFAPTQKSGSAVTLICDSSGTAGACTWKNRTSVTFTKSSSTEYLGAFQQSETRTAGCGAASDTAASFNVKFAIQ